MNKALLATLLLSSGVQAHMQWSMQDKQGVEVTYVVNEINSPEDLRNLCFRTFNERYKGRVDEADLAIDLEYHCHAIEKGIVDGSVTVVCAIRHGRLVGFVAVKPVSVDTTELYLIAVATELQRSGIGKELAFSVFKVRPEIKRIVVRSYKANVEAHAFYRKHGFAELHDEALKKQLSEKPERSHWFEFIR